MTTIHLTDDLSALAAKRAHEAGCATINEYIERLILDESDEAISPELEAELLKGLDSPRVEMTPQRWQEMAQRLKIRRAAARQ